MSGSDMGISGAEGVPGDGGRVSGGISTWETFRVNCLWNVLPSESVTWT